MMEKWELSRKKVFQLADLLISSANQLGFESVSFSEIGIAKKKYLEKAWHLFLGCNYPSRWINRYADNDYVTIDPVALVAPFSDVTVDWGEVSAMQREFFAEAAGFGLKTGIAIPLHVPGHTYIACFADKQDASITPALRNQLEGLSFVFLQAWIRQIMPRFDLSNVSPAVLRTVRYALIGHGVGEIADRLGIRRTTVERHLRIAMGGGGPGCHASS